jgi:hypothetical protein
MLRVLVKRLAVFFCKDRNDTTGRMPYQEFYRLQKKREYSEQRTDLLSNRSIKDSLDLGRNAQEYFCSLCYAKESYPDRKRSKVKTLQKIYNFIDYLPY